MARAFRLALTLVLLPTALLVGCSPAALPSDGATGATAQGLPAASETPAVVVQADDPMPAASLAADQAGFQIVPGESQARFIVDEVLFGQPKTVVGTTSDVTGTIYPDFESPASTTVGTITVDLATLLTDNNNRTRQVQTSILQTSLEGNRYARFKPTALDGLPESIALGQPFSFRLSGNLSIHGVTLPKMFEVAATAISDSRLEGIARLVIRYEEFAVQILRLPLQVASVSDEVVLELEFVAIGS